MVSKKNRKNYEALFQDYPDIIDTETARIMLGGIDVRTVLKLIKRGHLRHFHYHEQYYLIPKDWLIDYILSEHYATYKHSLKAQV